MPSSANWLYRLRVVSRRPWLRVALYSLAAVLAALASAFFAPLVPPNLAGSIGSEAVHQILSVLASSMLPVATFSLATMVQAYGAADSNVTPRAANLLMQDRSAQTALASFIGAFLYSVVGLIALRTSVYGEQGRVILFGITLAVLALVVATLVRWIDALARLGRIGETIGAIEAAADAAIRRRAKAPTLGGLPWRPAPAGAAPLRATQTGYIQHVDAGALDDLAEANGLVLHLAVLPGSFVHRGHLLAEIVGEADDEVRRTMALAFVIGDRRMFEDDPRFGVIVLAEVGSRALSSAINDSGTAIEVIGALVRVLTLWHDLRREEPEVHCHRRLYVPEITADDLFVDGFQPIARDGAGIVEVGIRLQKALAALATLGAPDVAQAATRHADLALARALSTLTFAEDRAMIAAARNDGADSSGIPKD